MKQQASRIFIIVKKDMIDLSAFRSQAYQTTI